MIFGSSNARQVLEKLQLQVNRLNNLTQPLQESGRIVRDAAVMRIKNQGGDQNWLPNKRGGHTGIDTGRMWGSIAISPPSSQGVTIGTNVPYARWFQEGTGIFAGHQPWTVTPNKKQALAFVIGGQSFVRKSVTIPGEPQRPFLLITPNERSGILKAFADWLNGEAA